MSTYVVVHSYSGPHHVVRTTDWVILATCADSSVADQIAALLSAA